MILNGKRFNDLFFLWVVVGEEIVTNENAKQNAKLSHMEKP